MIRAELNASGLNAANKDIIASLQAKGIQVSAAHVSNVKLELARQGQGKSKPADNSDGISVQNLLKAKELADKVGGLEKAQQALDVLSRLQ